MIGAEICETCGAEVAGDDAGYLMAQVICPSCWLATFRDAGDVIDVCEDCLLTSSGWPDVTREHGHGERYAAAVTLHGAEPVAMIGESGEVRSSFGKHPCAFCGSKLWGSRYDATLREVPA